MRLTDYDKLQLKLRDYADKKAAHGEIEIANGILKAKCFIDQECEIINEKQLNGGWIPASERLPTETERVLVTLENKMVLEVFFINNKFKYQGLMKGGGMEEVCQDNPVIAWQPLPELYKEDI